MTAVEPDARTIGLAVVAGIAVLTATRLWWRSATRRWASSRRRARAREGEIEAEEFLERRGYRILERQVRRRAHYLVDGAPRGAEVIADLLVARRGRRFIAEVKTGTKAPDPMHRATRRQLLEYAHAFDVDGLLLVDADQRRVSSFEVPQARRSSARWLWLALGLAAGAVAGATAARLLPSARAPSFVRHPIELCSNPE